MEHIRDYLTTVNQYMMTSVNLLRDDFNFTTWNIFKIEWGISRNAIYKKIIMNVSIYSNYNTRWKIIGQFKYIKTPIPSLSLTKLSAYDYFERALSIWWVKPFSTDFMIRSYVVLLYHCPRLGEGWDPANLFNPATLCMYVPVPSQEHVIQWSSFVYVLHICVSFIFCT